MSVPDRVRALIEPIVAGLDLELFDLEQAGAVLRVTLDKPGGVDVADLTETTRALSRAFDEHDPIAGQYTLEVSSPGLERQLRTARHWEWAANRLVKVKTVSVRPDGPMVSSNDAAKPAQPATTPAAAQRTASNVTGSTPTAAAPAPANTKPAPQAPAPAAAATPFLPPHRSAEGAP
jgi:ribosome maturation factor RimP